FGAARRARPRLQRADSSASPLASVGLARTLLPCRRTQAHVIRRRLTNPAAHLRERAPRASHAPGPPSREALRRGLAVALRRRKRAGAAAREGACRGVRAAKPLG